MHHLIKLILEQSCYVSAWRNMAGIFINVSFKNPPVSLPSSQLYLPRGRRILVEPSALTLNVSQEVMARIRSWKLPTFARLDSNAGWKSKVSRIEVAKDPSRLHRRAGRCVHCVLFVGL